MSDIVQKLWGFCHTLRHDGIDYGDYIEQLTYLLFLKMADERAAAVPKGLDWASLKVRSGTGLTDHYADILRKLREAGGLLADIFAQATIDAFPVTFTSLTTKSGPGCAPKLISIVCVFGVGLMLNV